MPSKNSENKLGRLHIDLEEKCILFKGLNILSLSQIFIADYYLGTYKSWHHVNVLKKMGLENATKFILFKITSLFLKERKGCRFDYLFISEVKNDPMLESLNRVYKEFANHNAAVIYSDIRLGQPGENSINAFEFATFGMLFSSVVDYLRFIPVAYRNREKIKFIADKYKVQRSVLFQNIFDSIFLINIIKNILSKISIGKIVLMSDVHKFSRIITLMAKTRGIQTFVLQHGATVGEAGYLPILADKMLVWGESSKNWYIERGQPASKIEKVGSPRMDNERFDELIEPQSQNWKKVLIVMSEVLIERPFLLMIRDALLLCGRRDIEITIKLHPGGAIDYSFMPKEIFDNTEFPYKILRYDAMKPLLAESDIVMVTTSTVGMEAIILRKPIFQYKLKDQFNYRMSYEDFDCSHAFETSEQLASLISSSETVYSKLPNYPSFVNYYFEKLDGGSSKRAKGVIINPSI